MKEITKAKFMWRLEREIIRWPPVVFDGKLYGFMGRTEGEDADFVWCTI